MTNKYDKLCCGCKITKDFGEFTKKSANRDGLNSRCKECTRSTSKSYYLENTSSVKKQKAEYRKSNQDSIKAMSLAYRTNNKEKVRECEARCVKNRRAKDPVFNLSYKTRRLISGYFRKGGFAKSDISERILGCSFGFFFSAMVTTAIKNYGFWLDTVEYHIDHIIPISRAESVEDVIRLNHYTNLQLLYPADNINKSNKLQVGGYGQ